MYSLFYAAELSGIGYAPNRLQRYNFFLKYASLFYKVEEHRTNFGTRVYQIYFNPSLAPFRQFYSIISQ